MQRTPCSAKFKTNSPFSKPRGKFFFVYINYFNEIIEKKNDLLNEISQFLNQLYKYNQIYLRLNEVYGYGLSFKFSLKPFSIEICKILAKWWAKERPYYNNISSYFNVLVFMDKLLYILVWFFFLFFFNSFFLNAEYALLYTTEIFVWLLSFYFQLAIDPLFFQISSLVLDTTVGKAEVEARKMIFKIPNVFQEEEIHRIANNKISKFQMTIPWHTPSPPPVHKSSASQNTV